MSSKPPRPSGASGRRGSAPGRPPLPAAADSEAMSAPSGGIDPLVGRGIAGHQVLQRTATGRLCSTYKANHVAMNRLVTFKVLSSDADATTIERFQQTARHAAQLHHPNIASIYDVNADAGVYFCTMEYIEGQSIGELLRARQRIPSVDAIRLAIDVAEALRFANAKNVPGWRLSANRVLISKRGEVKIIPPSFSPGGAPVLDDRYVLAAVGVLLYAMLTGGKVHDLEWALEPGSSAPAQLDRLKNVVPGLRRDIAEVVERLVGLAGEPFPNVDAALHGLRALLVAKEQIESRTRKAADSARVRVQHTRTGIYIAIGAVAFIAVVLIVLLLWRSGTRGQADRRYAEAAALADASFAACRETQKRFLAAPSEALAKEVLGHLGKARAALASIASQYPDFPQGQAAAQTVRNIDEETAKFQELAQVELRHVAAMGDVQALDKALDAEMSRRRETGGEIDLEAWRKRYLALRAKFKDSPKTMGWIDATLRRLPLRVLDEQIKVDANAVANEALQKYLPNLQYGKAMEAWNEYRRKYSKVDSDALRKRVLQDYDKATSDIRQTARLKFMALRQQAEYHVQKKEFEKAREIYRRVVESFGILEWVDRAKEELAKIPKS